MLARRRRRLGAANGDADRGLEPLDNLHIDSGGRLRGRAGRPRLVLASSVVASSVVASSVVASSVVASSVVASSAGTAAFGSAFFAALLVRLRAFVIGVAFCMSSS
jgi:hypothetical protein